jgi:predicted dehydrogenase
MGRTYRVAIIGTGRMGGLIEDEIAAGSFSKPYGHFSAYQAIEQTEVVAVANRGQERLERFATRFGVTNTYLDYREMIDHERPDIVSITTPSLARAEPLIYCAEHGVRGIYAEKGLSATLE